MSKSLKISLILLAISSISVFYFTFLGNRRSLSFNNSSKNIILDENGINYSIRTNSDQIETFLAEEKINIGENDLIIPEKNSSLYSGMKIEIQRARNIKIQVDGKEVKNHTLSKNVREVIRENGIALGRLDKVSPSLDSPPRENDPIIITRINIEEKTLSESIPFKTITKNDSKMGWREKKTEQKGEKGILEVSYKITYQNGREISRVKLSKNVVKEPTNEIIVQGTYVKIGKSHTGLGTWYAWKGGLYAASPWLPMGSYAKVTNRANGKSVIVEINDRGPFGENRIIDLDKVAFGKIASVGAGVIDVKVEEVLN